MYKEFPCRCGHTLENHCPFNGKKENEEQWCGITYCPCNDFKQDNLRYLEQLSETHT